MPTTRLAARAVAGRVAATAPLAFVVTGKKNMQVPADDGHITQWVRRLHHEGALLEALDDKLTPSGTDVAVEAQRLLLLGLACTSPNPSSRPSMTEVLQVINKLVPPPELSFEQPLLGWMPEESSSVSSSEYGGLPEANQERSSESKTTGGGHVSISFTQSEDVAPADASDQQTGR